MSAPAPSGGPSPLRVGGLALLGVGAVAGLIGLASLATSGGGAGGDVAAPPAATSTAEPPEFTTTDGSTVPPEAGAPTAGTEGVAPGESAAPGAEPGAPSDGGVPVPTFAPTAPTAAPGAPGGDGTGGAGGGDTGTGSGGTGGETGGGTGGGGSEGTAAGPMAPVRVYNNSNIQGLAADGAADFRAAGWEVTEVGGFRGQLSESTVYYRPGTSEQAVAENFGEQFGMRALPRFSTIENASPGVIVILTRDYQGANPS